MRSEPTIRKEMGLLRRQLAAAEMFSSEWWRIHIAIEALRWAVGARLWGPSRVIGAPMVPPRKSGPRPHRRKAA